MNVEVKANFTAGRLNLSFFGKRDLYNLLLQSALHFFNFVLYKILLGRSRSTIMMIMHLQVFNLTLFHVPRRNGAPVICPPPPLPPPKNLHPALETVLSQNFDFPDVTPIGSWKSLASTNSKPSHSPAKPGHLTITGAWGWGIEQQASSLTFFKLRCLTTYFTSSVDAIFLIIRWKT